MTAKKKEESNVKEGQESVVETQAEKNAKPTEMNAEQRDHWNEETRAINKLMERKNYDQAAKRIKDLPTYGFKGLDQNKAELTKEIAASKKRDKAQEKKDQDTKHVTLESVEKKLFDLSSEVDLLVKARARSGKPNRMMVVLKKRLDVLILQYSKFKKGSTD